MKDYMVNRTIVNAITACKQGVSTLACRLFDFRDSLSVYN